MTHNEKNQSTETSPDLTEMLKLRDMNFKTVVIIVFLIYKKLSTDMEDLKKNQPKSNFYRQKLSYLRLKIHSIELMSD